MVPDSNGIAWNAWQYLVHFSALSVSSELTEFHFILEFYGFSAMSTCYIYSRVVLREMVNMISVVHRIFITFM